MVLQINPFIFYFFLINVFQLSIGTLMYLELRKIIQSKVWDYLLWADISAIIHTIAIALLLNKIFLESRISFFYISLIAVFYTITVLMDILAHYYLIKPIIKQKINLLKPKYGIISLVSVGISTFVLLELARTPLPSFRNFEFLLIFSFIFLIILIYITYSLFHISKTYEKTGFVYKPFFVAGSGHITIFLYCASLLYYERNYFYSDYYYLLFWLISVVFAIFFYFSYIIEYPSLLHPRWKALMPFDIVKIATSITLAFLATSLYFTAKEYPTFAIYQNVSYAPLLIFLLVIIVAIMHILGYTRAIANRTHLKYWNYLRFGLSIHMVATFYVFGLIALEWSNFTIRTRALSTLFGLIALVFYILYASDMHVVISDLNIKFSFKKLDISRYLVSLYSLFFIIFFGISFTYNRTLGLLSEIRLESYPFILFFIAFFLLVFISYLSVTHKGFEEIMKKNVWSELSYLSSFAVFIVVYLMYISMTNVDRFPLHGMFFVAYFFVLIIETYAINTLGVRSKYEKEEEYAITDLLNFVAGHFLRSDYLVDIWEKNIDRYVDPKDMGKARFVAASRRFAINELDKETENTVATAMLFDLHHLSTENKVAVVTDDFYKTLKKDIEDILQEEILLLPEELRANFEEDKYYPLLFEKLVNDLMERIRTFVPSVEHKILFDKLSRISAVFADSAYDGEKIQIPHETRFSRAEFINHFKSYLNSLEELFPFEETLLYEPIKSGIKEEILNYGFSIEDLLDLVPTGVKKLDEITEGGLQRKTSTLILCGETRHKKEFLMSFVKQGIKDRDCVIFATSKDPSKVILNELRKEFLELEELTLIDLYQDIHTSKRVPNVIEKKNRIIIPTSTVFLRQSIVKTIKRYPKDSHKRVMLDVYNDLLRYFSYKELSTIIYQQLDGLRKWNCTTLLTLNPRQIPSENLEEMEKKFENILVISGKGREETILIKKLQGGAPKHKIISFH